MYNNLTIVSGLSIWHFELMNNLLIYPMICLNNKNIESFEHDKKPSNFVQLSRGIGYEQQFVIGGKER